MAQNRNQTFKRPKIRKTWSMNPVTQIKTSKKQYDRHKAKRQFKEELEELSEINENNTKTESSDS